LVPAIAGLGRFEAGQTTKNDGLEKGQTTKNDGLPHGCDEQPDGLARASRSCDSIDETGM
jgi:hypothetical protein